MEMKHDSKDGKPEFSASTLSFITVGFFPYLISFNSVYFCIFSLYHTDISMNI